MDLSYPVLTLVGSGAASGQVDVFFHTPGDVKALQDGTDDVVDVFVEAGGLGAFPSQPAAPPDSSIKLVSSSVQGQQLHYRLELTRVATQAFQVLRNHAARLQIEFPEVSRIMVREVGGKPREPFTLPPPSEDNELEVYPPTSTKLGFPFDFEEIEFQKARRCVVEHASAISPAQVEEAAVRVEAWFELLEGGGYALPVGHPAAIDSRGDSVSQFDEVSLEVSILSLRASDESWNALLNILGAYSQTGVPVTKVTIE